MSEKLCPIAKCATPNSAELRRSWLLDVRTVLGLSQPEMAAELALPLRTYQRREADPSTLRVCEYRRALAMLGERGVDSRGRMPVAKAVSA